MEIVNVTIENLRHASYNPRKITPGEFDQIKQSIESFGFVQPLVVNKAAGREGIIVGGNQRFQVAKKIGMKEVPVCYVDIPDLAREKELNIRLNRNQAEWDWEILQKEFKVPDLADWGFTPIEINTNFELPAKEENSDIPQLPKEPRTCRGEIYQLGPHRLMCGDSTDPLQVEKLLNGQIPILMVTDPPYGVNYNPNWRNETYRSNGKPIGGNAVGKVNNDDEYNWSDSFSLFPGHIVYVWHAGSYSGKLQKILEDLDYKIRSQIIWKKNHFVISRGDYHWQHEPCFYAVKNGETGNWMGDRSQSTVWEITHTKSETGHSTQKPLECMEKPIENNTAIGQSVYDPFLGSGTTLIAAEKLKRIFFGMEIDPAYCDVIIKRYCNFTGANEDEIFSNAVHLGSGDKVTT